MKKIMLFCFCLFISINIFSETTYEDTSMAFIESMNEGEALDVCTLRKLGYLTTSNEYADVSNETYQSGCCSHHRGVCGCSKGRKVCCDGELSPTCKC